MLTPTIKNRVVNNKHNLKQHQYHRNLKGQEKPYIMKYLHLENASKSSRHLKFKL